MTRIYFVTGLKCAGCAGKLLRLLYSVDGIREADIDLNTSQVEIYMSYPISIKTLQAALGEHFQISECHLPLAEQLQYEYSRYIQA